MGTTLIYMTIHLPAQKDQLHWSNRILLSRGSLTSSVTMIVVYVMNEEP